MKTTFFAIVVYFNKYAVFTIVHIAKIVLKFFVIFWETLASLLIPLRHFWLKILALCVSLHRNNSSSFLFENQTIQFALFHVTRGWLYKLTRMRARRPLALDASRSSHLTIHSKLSFSHAGKKLSLKIEMCFVLSSPLMLFTLKKPATFKWKENPKLFLEIVYSTAHSLLCIKNPENVILLWRCKTYWQLFRSACE